VIAFGTNFLNFFLSKVSFHQRGCVLGVHGNVGYLLSFVLSELGGCLYYLLNWEGGSSAGSFSKHVPYDGSSLLLDESIFAI